LINFETLGSLNGSLEGSACQVRANYDPIRTCQIQAHLARATPDLYDACIARDCTVHQARELTAFGAGSQPA